MAFSISYVYEIVDKYSATLKKINKVTAEFERKVESVQNKLGRLNTKLTSTRETFGKLDSKVMATRGRLGRLNKRIDQTGAALGRLNVRTNTSRREIKRFSAGFDGLHGAAASVAGIIGGSAMLNTFTSFEETMLTAKGTTGATEAQFAMLSKRAKELGITTQFSASQAAAGMETLGRNGLATTQILGGAIDAALQLSAATGTNLANSSDIATDVMANFGKQAGELMAIVDKITGVTINSKFSIDDYRLALGQAGGTAGAVGVSLNDFNTSIAAIAPLFTSGSDAGTSFKTFLTRLNPQSKESAALMKALNLNFFEADGTMKGMADIAGILKGAFSGLTEQQKSHVASTIFGIDAMRAALGLASAGKETFDKLEKSIAKVSAQKLAEERMRGLAGTMKRLKSAVEGVVIALFESGFAEILVDIGNRFAEIMRNVSKANPQLLKMAAIAGALMIVAAPLIVGFGILAGALTALISPVGAVIAGIAALITVGAALFSSNANIRDSLSHLWETIKGVGGALKPLITLWKSFFGVTEGAGGWIDAIAAGIKTLSVAINLLTLPLRTVAKIITDIIESGFASVVNKGLSAVGRLVGIKEGLGVRVGGVEEAEVRGKTAAERMANIRRIMGTQATEAAKGAAAEKQTMAATLNGSIKVSTDNGARVEQAEMSTNMPGNLGLNLGGA